MNKQNNNSLGFFNKLFNPGGNESLQNHLSLIIAGAFWLVCFVFTMRFVATCGPVLMDSDQAAELILAHDMGHFDLFDSNWFYSTAIRVFDIVQFMRVGALFTSDWMHGYIIGQALALLCLSLSIIYAARPVVGRKLSIVIAALMLCPFSYWYEFHAIMFGFYVPYIILSLVYTGISIRIYEHLAGESPRKSAKPTVFLLTLLGILLAFIGGLAGIRMLMNYFAPFVLMLVIFFGLKLHAGERVNIRLVLSYAAIVCGNLAGIVVNKTVLLGRYDFSDKSEQILVDFSISTVLDRLSMLISAFGYMGGMSGGQYAIFSLKGILALFGLITAFMFVFSMVMLCRRYGRLTDGQRIMFLTGVSMVIVTCITMSLLGESVNASYYLTSMPMLFIVIAVEIRTADFALSISRYAMTVVLAVCVIATSLYHSGEAIEHPLRAVPGLREIVTQLDESGYTKGSALFWDSNVVTAWTDGRIEMWTRRGYDADVAYEWLQKKSHVEFPEKYFLLVNKSDGEYFGEKELIMENEFFGVYY